MPSRPSLSPDQLAALVRRLRACALGGPSVSAADLARLQALLRPHTFEICKAVAYQVARQENTITLHLAGAAGIERITFDLRSETWQSAGSAGKGIFGLVARCLNRSDAGRLGALDAAKMVAECLGWLHLADRPGDPEAS